MTQTWTEEDTAQAQQTCSLLLKDLRLKAFVALDPYVQLERLEISGSLLKAPYADMASKRQLVAFLLDLTCSKEVPIAAYTLAQKIIDDWNIPPF